MFRAGLLLIIRRYYPVYIQQLVCVMLKIMELFKITKVYIHMVVKKRKTYCCK